MKKKITPEIKWRIDVDGSRHSLYNAARVNERYGGKWRKCLLDTFMAMDDEYPEDGCGYIEVGSFNEMDSLMTALKQAKIEYGISLSYEDINLSFFACIDCIDDRPVMPQINYRNPDMDTLRGKYDKMVNSIAEIMLGCKPDE